MAIALNVEKTVEHLTQVVCTVDNLLCDVVSHKESRNPYETARVMLGAAFPRIEKGDSSHSPQLIVNEGEIENISSGLLEALALNVQVSFLDQLNQCLNRTLANAWILSKNLNIFKCLVRYFKRGCSDELRKHAKSILVQILKINCTEDHFEALLNSEHIECLRLLNVAANANVVNDYILFTGRRGAGIKLPALKSLPMTFAFCIWVLVDTPNDWIFENVKPIVYRFASAKAVDYACRIFGNCFTLFYYCRRRKRNTKLLNFCIQKELIPRKWYLLTINHNSNQWTNQSTIDCYLNNEHVGRATINTMLHVSIEKIDRISLGCSLPLPGAQCDEENDSLIGAISAFYMFSTCLEKEIIKHIYDLGPGYRGILEFKLNPNNQTPPRLQKKAVSNRNPYQSIIFAYNSSCMEDSLLLQMLPAHHKAFSFLSNGQHAQLTGMSPDIIRVRSSSIYHCLHANQSNLKLLMRIHINNITNPAFSLELINIYVTLLNASFNFGHQFQGSQGFKLICASIIALSNNEQLLGIRALIKLCSMIIKKDENSEYYKFTLFSVMSECLLNSVVQQKIRKSVQKEIYQTIVSMILDARSIKLLDSFESDHRSHIVHLLLRCFHRESMNIDMDPEIIHLQLLSLRYFVCCSCMQSCHRSLNAVLALCESANSRQDDRAIEHIVQLIFDAICDSPKTIVPAFESTGAIKTIMLILNRQPCPPIFIKSIMVIGLFLKRSTIARKQNVIGSSYLFSLLVRMINGKSQHESGKFLTDATYLLFQMLTDSITEQNIDARAIDHMPTKALIENRELVVPICRLFQTGSLDEVRLKLSNEFIHYLLLLCVQTPENGRAILRIGIWQYTISSFMNFNEEADNGELHKLLSTLVYQALKYEVAGWRVWIDTMSVINNLKCQHQKKELGKPRGNFKFVLSSQHHAINRLIFRLISDDLVKADDLSEYLSLNTNRTFALNVIHVLSVMIELLIGSIAPQGGLITILAAFVDDTDKDITQMCESKEFSREAIASMIELLSPLVDVCLLSTQNTALFTKVEKEREKESGIIIRQFLRFYIFNALWNCAHLKRLSHSEGENVSDAHYDNINDPSDLLLVDLVDLLREGKLMDAYMRIIGKRDGIVCGRDTCRFRNLIYREVGDSKQARSMLLSILYFFSILMVSKYRRIISDSTKSCSGNHFEEPLSGIDKTFSICGSFINDILIEYSHLLDHTLLSTHGQDLFKTGLQSLKTHNYSSVALVMLLCSQEWQAALQKYAGAAFVALVNEGRLLDWDYRNNLSRVSNEADFIFNKQNADLDRQHRDFLDQCTMLANERTTKFGINEHFLDFVTCDTIKSTVNPLPPDLGKTINKYTEMSNFMNIQMNDGLMNHLNDGLVKYCSYCNLIEPFKTTIAIIWINENSILIKDKKNAECIKHIEFDQITMILSRSCQHSKDALEIFYDSASSILIKFSKSDYCQIVVSALPDVGLFDGYGIPRSRESCFFSSDLLFKRSAMTEKWQHYRVSNFDYLMFLNTISERSMQNTEHYPILPWIIIDYESPTINLRTPDAFRDLSKPFSRLPGLNEEQTESEEYYDLIDEWLKSNVIHSGILAGMELPPWASSKEEFIFLNRFALESQFTSCQLHQWIDYQFGYKSFNPIISVPHPPRLSLQNKGPFEFEPSDAESCTVLSFPSSTPIVFVETLLEKEPYILTLSSKLELSINPYHHPSSAYDSNQSAGKRLAQLFAGVEEQRLPINPDPILNNSNECTNRRLILNSGLFNSLNQKILTYEAYSV
ncbi:hypothetical protein ACOME3_007640 [Neoechinorhynchus agilis]